MRIGQGFDTHSFIAGKDLVLGGVKIPYEKGLKAHSDGDAVLHAICDAMLGALALGDIGTHFADTDPAHANRDSREFLRSVNKMVTEEGFQIGNLDVTIIAEQPKINPHVAAMRAVIAQDCMIDISQVSIKATRNEKMGHLGRGEGIAVHAVCLITKIQ